MYCVLGLKWGRDPTNLGFWAHMGPNGVDIPQESRFSGPNGVTWGRWGHMGPLGPLGPLGPAREGWYRRFRFTHM